MLDEHVDCERKLACLLKTLLNFVCQTSPDRNGSGRAVDLPTRPSRDEIPSLPYLMQYYFFGMILERRKFAILNEFQYI